MRIAFFSPLPPAKSGIADYSAAVLEHLKHFAEVETFAAKPAKFDRRALRHLPSTSSATIRITALSMKPRWNIPAWW